MHGVTPVRHSLKNSHHAEEDQKYLRGLNKYNYMDHPRRACEDFARRGVYKKF